MLTLFSLPNCVQCGAVKRWLVRRGLVEGVDYVVKDMSTDKAAFQQVQDLGYGAAPVVLLPDGTHFYGFDIKALGDWRAGLSL